jgi:hypothetical protein
MWLLSSSVQAANIEDSPSSQKKGNRDENKFKAEDWISLVGRVLLLHSQEGAGREPLVLIRHFEDGGFGFRINQLFGKQAGLLGSRVPVCRIVEERRHGLAKQA